MPDPFSESPLFKSASRELRQLALESFQRSRGGQILRMIRDSRDRGGTQLERALQRYDELGPSGVLSSLSGTPLGQLARQIERYKRKDKPSRALLESFLKSLGPGGEALRALVYGAEKASDLTAAINLVRASGYEVLPPKHRRGLRNIQRPGNAAIKFLQDLGIHVQVEEGEEFKLSRPTEPPKPKRNAKINVRMETGIERAFPANHPLVTGDMVPTPNSTNVEEFGYDMPNGILYVRFQTGSLYAYNGVTPEEFLSLYRTRNRGGGEGGDSTPGTWVWTHLRVRGTISGHRKDYQLAGIVADYVPRKATLLPEGEAYIQRKIKTTGGEWRRSQLPEQLVRALAPVKTSGARGPRGIR